MDLYEKIVAIYPDIGPNDLIFNGGTISLRNDSDGRGDYIERWEHPVHPRPTDEQLKELE